MGQLGRGRKVLPRGRTTNPDTDFSGVVRTPQIRLGPQRRRRVLKFATGCTEIATLGGAEGDRTADGKSRRKHAFLEVIGRRCGPLMCTNNPRPKVESESGERLKAEELLQHGHVSS